VNIKILSLHKTDSSELRLLEEEYLKRLRRYIQITVINVKRSKVRVSHAHDSKGDAKKIRNLLTKEDCVVLLSEKGTEYTSLAFADFIKKKIHSGLRTITFIIGGPAGLPQKVLPDVHSVLSLSRMTFPHKLTRLLLIEALYRTFDILHGGPYNK